MDSEMVSSFASKFWSGATCCFWFQCFPHLQEYFDTIPALAKACLEPFVINKQGNKFSYLFWYMFKLSKKRAWGLSKSHNNSNMTALLRLNINWLFHFDVTISRNFLNMNRHFPIDVKKSSLISWRQNDFSNLTSKNIRQDARQIERLPALKSYQCILCSFIGNCVQEEVIIAFCNGVPRKNNVTHQLKITHSMTISNLMQTERTPKAFLFNVPGTVCHQKTGKSIW